jgi:hypothetical protein
MITIMFKSRYPKSGQDTQNTARTKNNWEGKPQENGVRTVSENISIP